MGVENKDGKVAIIGEKKDNLENTLRNFYDRLWDVVTPPGGLVGKRKEDRQYLVRSFFSELENHLNDNAMMEASEKPKDTAGIIEKLRELQVPQAFIDEFKTQVVPKRRDNSPNRLITRNRLGISV